MNTRCFLFCQRIIRIATTYLELLCEDTVTYMIYLHINTLHCKYSQKMSASIQLYPVRIFKGPENTNKIFITI